MKKVLISSFDMEVGGVERSLISMLENFDYSNYDVDLMLYRHTGDFFKLLPNKPNLLNEVKEYSTFRKSISEVFKEGKVLLGIARTLAKFNAKNIMKKNNFSEEGHVQMQYMWKYSMSFLPKLEKEYDVAISYLWPHYFIAEKVKAKKKIAWIHTDFSKIETDIKLDLEMWNNFNHIIAVSEECKKSFLIKYPTLHNKVKVMENITSPEFIKKMSNEKVEDNLSKDNSFKIVSVARLSHAKGIDNAVKALKILHDKNFKNIKWYVVGYGGDEAMIKDLIKENNLEDRFILLGKKINPYPYMKDCDLYVQPSRYEGKAVTVTEAKILGKPVVITNYTTAKSQVKSGEDGYICDLSVEGIAKGIKTMYKYPELKELIANKCVNTDYGNKEELDKLYELF
ncbi:glycosyltransferase [Clostridium tarantellae]|uniref:Glycosyltransferase n=1 Tax=Clostridium tarantellae TaxID=39493 RepID=A0A6I1MPT2_9CLOT|nr:glycosyltransferase [Clostridium tarantellae]MPQ42299.1 glycosyltransferase [Clostridium tarantellae]